jgi:putative membrane protein
MYSIRQSLTASLCAVVGILCMAVDAQSATMMSLSPADRAFMMKASESNIGEIAAGKLAEDDAGSKDVRLLGKRYADNHRTNEERLSVLAAKCGMKLPNHPTLEERIEWSRLNMLHGRRFETAFLQAELDDHRKSIAMFKREIREGSNPLVVAYAKKSLPVLDEHLLLARDDAARMHMTAQKGR